MEVKKVFKRRKNKSPSPVNRDISRLATRAREEAAQNCPPAPAETLSLSATVSIPFPPEVGHVHSGSSRPRPGRDLNKKVQTSRQDILKVKRKTLQLRQWRAVQLCREDPPHNFEEFLKAGKDVEGFHLMKTIIILGLSTAPYSKRLGDVRMLGKESAPARGSSEMSLRLQTHSWTLFKQLSTKSTPAPPGPRPGQNRRSLSSVLLVCWTV